MWFRGIPLRLFAFMTLLAFLPAGAMLFLKTYERQMLSSQERAMVQQGRLLASALSGTDSIDRTRVTDTLIALRQRQEARIRVISSSGTLLGDTSIPGKSANSGDSEPSVLENPLYRLASFPVRFARRLFGPPVPVARPPEYYDSSAYLSGPEVQQALTGSYGAATRISGGQRSVTLYSAIPVFSSLTVSDNQLPAVTGVVLVSQSTYRILNDLYRIRLDIFRVFLLSLAAAILVSIYLSYTISRPLIRLRDEARLSPEDVPAGTIQFSQSERRDQIGELSLAFQQLTNRLKQQLEFSEHFAADVSHEFRNPLSSIRSAAEMLSEAEEATGELPFPGIIQEEVARLERLLRDVAELTRLDAKATGDSGGVTQLLPWLSDMICSWQETHPETLVQFLPESAAETVMVSIAPERLLRVLENLMDNAATFSPKGSYVTVSLSVAERVAVIEVADSGPGIPEAHLSRVFDRFFTYRPDGDGASRSAHSGLGLSIVQSVVKNASGNVSAANRPQEGAAFRVELPVSQG